MLIIACSGSFHSCGRVPPAECETGTTKDCGIQHTGIEVQGKHFEGAAVGYNGERQYWLHSVFVGRAWVSARLNEGGTDVKGDFAEQLAADVDALDLGPYPVWARADAAYYCEAFVKDCMQRGWDYSVSVTDPNKKAPVLRIVEEMELDPKYWEPLDEQGVERAVVIRIVSCDLDHIAPGTQPIHFSRTFVGTQGCTAERRCLSCCLGSPYGIDADYCLFLIISFLR